MTKKFETKIGCDPEFFITNGSKVSSDINLNLDYIIPPASLISDLNVPFDFINSKKVLFKKRDYQFSEDGAAIELQMRPASSIDEFIKRINSAKKGLEKYLSNYNLSYSSDTVAYFDLNNFWTGRDETFQNCVQFGCDPDMFPQYYSHIETGSRGVIDASNHSYRYGGGHLHLQCYEDDPQLFLHNWESIAFVFDIVVGLYYTSQFKYIDKDIVDQHLARLKFYGKPGRIRLQSYSPQLNGIEYRVLSNHWVFDDTILSKLLILTNSVAKLAREYVLEDIVSYFSNSFDLIHSTITNLDFNTGNEMFKHVIPMLVNYNAIDDDDSNLIVSTLW